MSVNRIAHPELFFGLVAPVGVDLDMIIEVLRTELILQKYDTSPIHVTEIMRDVPSNIVLNDETYLERINTRIEYADEICSRIERDDALASITITAIQSIREGLNTEITKKEGKKLPTETKALQEALQEPIPRQAYILRQFQEAERDWLAQTGVWKAFLPNLRLQFACRARIAQKENQSLEFWRSRRQ